MDDTHYSFTIHYSKQNFTSPSEAAEYYEIMDLDYKDIIKDIRNTI